MARNPFDPVEEPLPELPEPPEPGPPVRHDDVVARVRELLGKYPTLKSRQLFDLAVRMHPDLEQHGFRSFHARYVLPLKREQARAEGRIAPRKKKTAEKQRKAAGASGEAKAPVAARPDADVHRRARVREVLLRLARDVAVAESRADLVDALARVEDCVNDVMKAMKEDGAA
jgi:hypothetical protein